MGQITKIFAKCRILFHNFFIELMYELEIIIADLISPT